MRRKSCLLFPLILLCFSGFSHAQLWSGILSSNRAIDWTQVGVQAGIPARTSICATVNASTYGNGSSDATSGIQAALNSCASGSAVSLSAGTFLISSHISIPSNVTLRGAGANQTVLNVTGSGNAPILLGSGGVSSANASASVSITSGSTAGSNTIVVSNASGITVGKYIMVTELNDSSYVTNVGGEGTCTWCDQYWSGNRARGQIVQVTSISGTSIGISPSLYSNYSLTPLATVFSASASYAGVENLQVYANNTGYTADFYLSGCANCWLKGVEANYADGDFVQVHWGYHDEIRDSYFSNAYDHVPGTVDADIFIVDKTSCSLVENNIIERGHASLLLNWGAAGNVIAYNYIQGAFDTNATNFVLGGIGMHGAHPQFNLIEGNFANLLYPDQVWGSSSHNTTFRNWWTGTTRACNPTSGRGTVACGWWPYQASRAEQIAALSTSFNLVGDIAGSQNQINLLINGNPTSHVAILTWPSSRSYDSTNYNMTFGYGESSDGGSGPGFDSANPYNTALLYKVYTFDNGVTNCISNGSASTCNTALPASFYRSSKPAWWGSLPWPAIGPDVTGSTGPGGHSSLTASNPAQNCYINGMKGSEGGAGSPLTFNASTCYGSSSAGPAPPTNLTVVVS